MHKMGYHLGLPAWAFPGWRDTYFVDNPSRLSSYASVFNTVEGNTTFYGTPDANTVARWRDAVAGTDFRFCLKLPREVTHEHRPDFVALDAFLAVIEPLADHLGPLLVQFPADIGPAEIGSIELVLERIAGRYGAAVEVRHPALFAAPEILAPMLERHAAGRVALDARPLHLGDRQHPEVLAALHKKPDLPVLPETMGELAFVRLVLHPDLPSNEPYIKEWVTRTAGYLADDIDVWMMIHCPNNQHCPTLALDFHNRLRRKRPDISPLPAWPVPQQMSLV